MSEPKPSPFYKDKAALDADAPDPKVERNPLSQPTAEELNIEALGAIGSDFLKISPILPPNVLELVKLALLRAYANGASNTAQRILKIFNQTMGINPEDDGSLPVKAH